MLLVGEGRSEHSRHYAVASKSLIDETVVLMNGFHQHFDHRRDNCQRVLGIKSVEQAPSKSARRAKRIVTCLR